MDETGFEISADTISQEFGFPTKSSLVNQSLGSIAAAEYCNLAASLVQVRITNDLECSCARSYQNIGHIAWQCPLFDTQRMKLVQQSAELKLQPSMIVCLAKPNVPTCNYVLSFLKDRNAKVGNVYTCISTMYREQVCTRLKIVLKRPLIIKKQINLLWKCLILKHM